MRNKKRANEVEKEESKQGREGGEGGQIRQALPADSGQIQLVEGLEVGGGGGSVGDNAVDALKSCFLVLLCLPRVTFFAVVNRKGTHACLPKNLPFLSFISIKLNNWK